MPRILIRFSILLIALFLLFSITSNDPTQIAYASDNLTDVELGSDNTSSYTSNDSSTTPNISETSNSSSELIDPSGTVTSWAGYPISGLTVAAWQGSQLINQTTTDGNGEYNLDLAPGIYELTAGGIDPGGTEYITQSQQVDVQEPLTVNFHDMLVKSSIYGLVTDKDGNSIQYAMAEVYDENSNGIDDTDTGTNGLYDLDLSYYFSQQDPSVTSASFRVIFYDDLLQDQEFTIQINRDEAYRLDAVMQPATILQGTVTGQSTVLNAGTDVVSNVILYYEDQDGTENSYSSIVDSSGNYYFKVNPSLVTVHHIGMNVYGYQEYYHPITLNPEEVTIHNIILVEKGIIQVTVTNSSNNPLNGVSVSVGNDDFNYRTVTGADGVLNFAVENSTWTVSASYPDYIKAIKYITVFSGGTNQVNIILIQAGLPVVMEGYVTDTLDGSPLANARLYFWPIEHPTQTGTYAQTDANGYYKFVTNPNYLEFISGASGYLEILPLGHQKPKILITIGQEGQGQNIRYDIQLMPYTGSVTVYTLDVNNQPVLGVTVCLWGDEDLDTISDSNGKAVFERVGPSEWWELYIYDNDNRYYNWDSYYYTLEEGQSLEVTTYLVSTSAPAEIKGNVLDPNGEPVSSAKVELYLLNGGNWIFIWSSKTTDSLGYFSLNLYGTSANLMRVNISKSGYQNAIYDFLPGNLPVNQNFLLTPESLTEPVSGHIYDYLGNPLQGVQVEALQGVSTVTTVYTGLSGGFNFELPAGNYQLRVSHNGYLPQTDSFNLAVGGEYQVNFTLLRNGSLYGIITGFNNAPVNGATVNLLQNGNVVDSTTSNANGQYQTSSLTPGSYMVQIQATYYETLEQGPFTITDGTASYQGFMMQPTASSSIHGYVTDKVTGLPIPNVNVALYYGEDSHTACITDQNGVYSFQNILPRNYYMEFTAIGYIEGNANIQVGLGQNELNKTLEAIVPGTIKGNVTCWAGPVLGAIVTLDGLTSFTTGADGTFEFDNIARGWHQVTAEIYGISTSWYNYLANGEVKSLEFYLNLASVLDGTPYSGAVVNQLSDVKVRIRGAKPEAEGASIYVYRYVLPNPQAWWYVPELIPGTTTKDNDWLIFTPETSFGYGTHTVQVKVGTELDQSYDFYIYPVTNIAPFILSFNPADGSFFRDPGSIELSTNVQNSPGNGLSAITSYISVDGTVLPTTISRQSIDAYACLWKLQATVDSLGHGWHYFKAVAVDNQGLRAELNWRVFVSRATTFTISNVQAPLFSPYNGGMRITADISEPIRGARMILDAFPSYPVWLGSGSFDDKIDTIWDGYLKSIYYVSDGHGGWTPVVDQSFLPPDGTYSFTIIGQTVDGLQFDTATGSIQIDSTPPELNVDSRIYYDNRDLTIHGSVYDLSSGISTFEAVTSGGTIQIHLSGGIFNVDLNVETDGQYTVTIIATDLAGNGASFSKTIWVDTVDPTLSFISPEVGSEVRPAQILSFHLGDNYSGLHRDYITYHPILTPLNIEITLDCVSIKDQIIYTDWSYGFSEYNAAVYGWAASLLGITGTYDSKLNGYLIDGNHTLNITVQDMAGNKIERTLRFSSITKKPDVTEKDISMTVNTVDQTLYFSGIIQENSDRGIKNIRLFLDGVAVTESMLFTSDGLLPYKGTASWTITRSFTTGAHTLVLWVIDNLDLENSLHTGFYYLPQVSVDNNGFTSTTDYFAQVPAYTGDHWHTVSLTPYCYFKQGSQALWGGCKVFAPSNVLYDPTIPMGSQQAFTYAQSAYVNAQDTTHVSLWMIPTEDGGSSYWGWGDGIAIYFDDGTKRLPYLVKTNFDQWPDETTGNLIYAHHEPPWANPAGLIDEYVATAVGADGNRWKQYIVEIPEGVDKSHLSIVVLWRAINWNSWGSGHSTSIYSIIDNIEFITALVTDVHPSDGSKDVGLQPVVSAKYSIPLDPETFTSDTFYLQDLAGNKVATSNNYNENTMWGSMTPMQKLNGKTKYIAYVSPDIRTIYGRILPEPSAYEWSFTTREGESLRWQSILYNGEQYDVFLTFGEGYNGNKPGYISPSTIAAQTGASIVGVYVTKNGYEVADMDLKKKILVAAERKAFYETVVLAYYGRLISQSNIDWADNGANTWSGDFLDNLSNFLPGGNPSPPPDAKDVIQDTVTTALSDGSDPYGVPGAINSALSWFSTIVGGCDTVNSMISALNKVKPIGITKTIEESCAGDVLEVAGLVGSELAFQKDLWDFVYKTMWQIEITNKYYNELSYVRSCSSGDTYTALNNLLSTDSDDIKDLVAQKVAEHIADQTVDVIRDAVWEAIKDAGPYGKALYYICKSFNLVLDKVGVLDVHAKCHAALDQQDAEYNTYRAWISAVSLMNYINLETPDDMALISTSSKLRYSSAGDFYTTLASACEIVKNWPFSDSTAYNSVLPSYYSTASDYYSHSSNVIPEISTSTADLNALFPLIRQGIAGKVAYIQIGAHSPIALLVTDELGRRIGYDPGTGQNVNDFAPDGGYTGPYTEPQLISIPSMAGKLIIQAFGTGSGSYTIDLETYDANGLLISGSSWTGTAVPGVTQIFTMSVDSYGDVSPVDLHPPEITVNGITDGSCYTNGVTPQIIVNDDNLQSWFATLNGNSYTGNSVSDEGTYSLFVRATDGINVVYRTLNFAIDLTPPQINILGFNNGDYYQMVHPYLNVEDDNLGSVSLNLDGNPLSEDPVRTDGQHTVTAIATDDAGHQSSASGSFTIDNTNPTIDIFGLVNGTIYQGGVAPTISISDLNLALSNLSLDGTTYSSGNAILNTLRHHLVVDAVDKAGNHATREIWFIVIPNGGVIITNAGGTANSGSTNLNFPTGAVNNDTAITINQLSEISNTPTNFLFAGHAFNVLSENLQDGTETSQMNQPVIITIHYSDLDVAGFDENSLVILFLDPTTSTWKPLSCIVDTQNNIITGSTGHFSTFALMGTTKQEPSTNPVPETQPVQTTPTTQQNSGTTQNLDIITKYSTSNLLISAPLTLQSPSAVATVPVQQQANEETTSGINNFVIYALIFIVAVLLIVLLSRRIIKS